jgi:hypothetical protein
MRVGGVKDFPVGGRPVVSPDGRRLLVSGDDGTLVVVDDRGRRRIASAGVDPVWSADGEWIVFRGLSAGLSVIRADGKHGRRVTRDERDEQAVWSPDGAWIAFERYGVGLLVVRADGTQERLLWRGEPYELTWSKDARTLRFVVPGDSRSTGALVQVDAATGRVRRRVRGRFSLFSPGAWSPDGRRLAFQEDANEGRGPFPLTVVAADGTGRRRASAPGKTAGDPAWSPDGRTLLYGQRGVDGRQLWTSRPDGSRRRRVTRGFPAGGNVIWAVWTRARLRPEPSPYRIVARRTSDGAELELPFAVAGLGGSGARVALASQVQDYSTVWLLTPPLVLWNPIRGSVSRLFMDSCGEPDSIVVSAQLLAHDCRRIPHAVAYYGGHVRLFRGFDNEAVILNEGLVDEEGGKPGKLPGRIAGAADEVVFAVDAFNKDADYAGSTLWRVRGRRAERIATNVGEPVAVDRGRIATEHPRGVVGLLDLDGRIIRAFSPGGRGETPPVYGRRRSPTVGLSGRHLVALRSGRLTAYDATAGQRLIGRSVDHAAVLAGVADGLVAWVVRRQVFVLRLRDHAATVVRPGGRSVRALLTSAGLFYVSHEKPVGPVAGPLSGRENRARVVFIRRDALERRLR